MTIRVENGQALDAIINDKCEYVQGVDDFLEYAFPKVS